MCQCTPNIRTPFCGKGDCQWPTQVERNNETLKEKYDKEYPQVSLSLDMLKLILYDSLLPKEKVDEIMTKVANCQR